MISVVVPVRNGMPWLEEELRALAEQVCQEPWEIIVVDNNSTDESNATARAWADRVPRMRVVEAPRVTGPGAARNAGVRAAEGDLLAFCDADDVARPGWLAAHVAALAVCDISAGVFDAWSLNGLPMPSPPSYAPPPAMTLFGFLPAAGSGNLGMRRSAFEAIGGFSEDLMTGEDFDLSWRAQLAGHQLSVTADAVVARRDQQGFGAVFRRYLTYGKCGPVLYRRYRSDGLRSNLALAAKTWVWLGLSAPRLVQHGFRDRWARLAGWRLGCLVESVRQRVLFL